MCFDLPRKMLGQRARAGLLAEQQALARAASMQVVLLCAVGFQLFQLQLKLLDLPLDLLRAASELHALQLGDEQRQMLDLVLRERVSCSCCSERS